MSHVYVTILNFKFVNTIIIDRAGIMLTVFDRLLIIYCIPYWKWSYIGNIAQNFGTGRVIKLYVCDV